MAACLSPQRSRSVGGEEAGQGVFWVDGGKKRFFRSAASKTMRAFVLERAAAGGEIRLGKRRGRAGFSRRIAKGCG